MAPASSQPADGSGTGVVEDKHHIEGVVQVFASGEIAEPGESVRQCAAPQIFSE